MKLRCQVCGAELTKGITDLPFKTGPTSIVILKELPVLQCGNCGEFLMDDPVMERVENLLDQAAKSAELEIFRYAA